jgi:hypothetical protein
MNKDNINKIIDTGAQIFSILEGVKIFNIVERK